MMNAVRFFSTKSYIPKRSRNRCIKSKHAPNPGIDNRLKLYQDDTLSEESKTRINIESFGEDIDHFESKSMLVGKTMDEYNRKFKIQSEMLKNQITFNKHLKSVEPSFLTFAEKEQIKLLHESDPNEWNAEKLSESFPALPETIKKVLHVKRISMTKEAVLRYDQKVICNWEALRAGELSISSKLKEHLEKFSDREIIITKRDKLAERYESQKMELPKPESKLFSTIAKTFLLPSSESEPTTNDEKDIAIHQKLDDENVYQVKRNYKFEEDLKENSNLLPSKRDAVDESAIVLQKEEALVSQNSRPRNFSSRRLTFDQFLKSNVGRTEYSDVPEDIVLRETYKKEMEKSSLSQNYTDNTNQLMESNTEAISEFNASKNSENRLSLQEKPDLESNIQIREEKKIMSSSVTMDMNSSKQQSFEMSQFDKSSLDTYVKEWHKKHVADDNVAKFIKIPDHRFKKGMTYRVKDCFYDDDGELLYRVPGLFK